MEVSKFFNDFETNIELRERCKGDQISLTYSIFILVSFSSQPPFAEVLGSELICNPEDLCGLPAPELEQLHREADLRVRDLLEVLKRLLEPGLKGSIGEGSNHSNFSHQSSVKILSKFNAFR